MRDFKIAAVLADLHLGNKNVPADDIKQQLKDNFIKPLKEMKYLDGIFILGDLLHAILSNNSQYVTVFYWLIDQVYKIARKRNAIIVIIKGTASHDNDQLNNIKYYQNNEDHVDFRVYDTVEEITIWDNYKVLILPDVKVKDTKDIDQYLSTPKKYDMILGHGLINEMQFVVQESENMPTKTYVYDVDDLVMASKGPVLFGHIHQYQNYHNHFYYVGPFTLLERGGTDAGFVMLGIYDKDRSKFKVEHYINTDSGNYYELELSKKLIDSYSIDDIMESIDLLLKETKANDLITLRIIRGDERNASDKVLMLENKYQKDRRISIIKKIKTQKEEEQEEENKTRKERYAYIMDDNMDMAAILYRYYTEDVIPSLPESSKETKIKLEDFERILKK